MKNTQRGFVQFLAVLVVLALAVGAAYYAGKTAPAPEAPAPVAAGEYRYRCDGGLEFSMTPASDMSSLRLVPGAGASFQESVALFKDSSAGQRFEGDGLVFIGAGEGVRLTAGATTVNCQPVPDSGNAPFNFGDAGEGGGVQVDVSLIVTESVAGKWASADDAKFTREFKADGTVVDSHGGQVVAQGSWKVFTRNSVPAGLTIPVVDDAAYIQMTVSGSQAETLNFKVAKLTPDELELVYLDRGGVLRFTAAD